MTTQTWGLLGQLKFAAVDSPDSLSVTESESFAEIPLIQSKPVTQWVGSELRDLKMSFFFDYGWCNPAAKLKQLQEMLAAHQPLSFSFGEGNYNGNYYLENIDGSVSKTLPSGEMLELSVKVSLKETTDLPPASDTENTDSSANASGGGTFQLQSTKQQPKKSPFERVR